MSDGWLFAIGVILLTIASFFWAFKSWDNIHAFLVDPTKKKERSGIIMFLLFGIVLAIASDIAHGDEPKGEWFAYGEVYLGVDYTFKVSPMCFTGPPNDRLTSHGGLRANIWQSAGGGFQFNTKYTHHSCAFNGDRERYDSVGFELVKRLW